MKYWLRRDYTLIIYLNENEHLAGESAVMIYILQSKMAIVKKSLLITF